MANVLLFARKCVGGGRHVVSRCACVWISCTATLLPGQRSSLWDLTAQLLAALHAPAERSVLPLSMATDTSQFPAWQQHPNRPHEFLPPQTPSRRWRRSSLAHWRCTTTASPKRFVPCRFRWRIEVTRLNPHFPMTLRNPTQRDSERGHRHGTISPAGLRHCLARGLPYRRQEVIMEGCPGGKGRRVHRVTGACRRGEDCLPGADPDIVPRVAALRTGAMQHLPTLRQACTRPADHKGAAVGGSFSSGCCTTRCGPNFCFEL
ncbi:hypothetical protein Tc00.1047053508633.40 [Trypanosoma cruzi]|uniref:Uncharacterized protein n=1 Tax=Trypanosoma cruzi (strain CL Brener) TaxID=353153 RepID=Q4DFJ3_TRYCC|nr:hypothetical protein Tc00.1047053508633.40 [Trypanosoma cruzi]EAN91293.1 hypothetical protein Tc00.1047053508633.40 [Trypanosoma cruzi]|eukprot:XP_813144.1 hypothetical protein [Trypanosoma cruzi strain CL Brener]